MRGVHASTSLAWAVGVQSSSKFLRRHGMHHVRFERSVMLMSSYLDVCVGCISWETASCGQSVHLHLGLVKAEAITAWVSYQMCPHSKLANVNVSQQRLKGWPWPVVHGGGQAWCKHRPMHILPVSTCHGSLTCINVQCLDPMHQMGLCKPTAYTKR